MLRRHFLKALCSLPFAGLLLASTRCFARINKTPVPTTADELYAAMNRVVGFGPSTKIQWSVIGEEYIERAIGTRLDENSEARLCLWMWKKFLKEIRDTSTSAKIYWRIKPEIIIFDANENFDLADTRPRDPALTMRLYARYLISDKPILVSSEGGDFDSLHSGERQLLRLAATEGWRVGHYQPLQVKMIGAS